MKVCLTCCDKWKWVEPKEGEDRICPACKIRLTFKTHTPDHAQYLNRQGWVLRKVKQIERPNTEPRKYVVIGRQDKFARARRHMKP